MQKRPYRHARRGLATVEAAVLLPVLIAAMTGLWELGRLIQYQEIVANATREAGRQAATGKYTKAQIQHVVTEYFQHAGVKATDEYGNPNVTVTVTNLTTGAEVLNAVQGNELKVEVTFPVKNVRWVLLNAFVSDTATLIASTRWEALSDVPVSVDKTIPAKPR